MPNDKPRFVKKKLIEEADRPVGKSASRTRKSGSAKLPPEKVMELPVVSNREDEKIKKQLQDIYKNADGSMPNMADFKRKQRSRLLGAFFFLLFSCIFLAAVAWAGFFIFQPGNNSAETDVALTIAGDEQVGLGQTVVYRVRYRNEQNIPLSKVSLQLRYPNGFVFSSSTITPTNEAKDEWQLGSLPAQGSGLLEITGKFYGNAGEQQNLRAFLNYYSANFSSEFQKVASLAVNFSKPLVELQVKTPTEISVGTQTNLVLLIKKLNAEPIKNVMLVLDVNKAFDVSSSSVAADVDNNLRWTFAELTSDQKIEIKGNFLAGLAMDKVTLKFSLLSSKENDKKESYVLATAETQTKLASTALTASLVINSSTSDFSVKPGELLKTTINLNNTGSENLTDLEVSLILDTPSYQNKSLLDWKKVNDTNDGDISGEQLSPELRRGIIVWNSKKITNLSSLTPGQQLAINFNLPLKDKNTVDLASFVGSQILATAQIKYKAGEEQLTINANQFKLTVNSDLTLTVRNSVSTDNQGRELHNLSWALNNSLHDLKDIQISTDFYGDITWLPEKLSVPAGTANFEAKNKKLVWQVPIMPLAVDVLALQFGVVLNTKNISQTNLTSDISLKARDTVTGETINQILPGVLLQ